MAGDRAPDRSEPSDLPDQVSEWLERMASQQDVSEEELLGRLLAGGMDGDGAAGSGEGAPTAAVEERLDALEADVEEKIQDVRQRVIQVKREADAKAPADHDHDDLHAAIEDLRGEVETLRTELEDLDERLGQGFENYEAVLEYLTDTTEDLDGKVDTLARSVLDLREQADAVAEAHAKRVAVAELAQSANEAGISRADCESCGESVDISLLSAPRCPHCAEPFSGLEAQRGLFGSSVLHVGTPPALAPGEDDTPDLADVVEDEADEDEDESFVFAEEDDEEGPGSLFG